MKKQRRSEVTAFFALALTVPLMASAQDIVEVAAELSPGVEQEALEQPLQSALSLNLSPIVDLPSASSAEPEKLQALENQRDGEVKPLQVGIDRHFSPVNVGVSADSAVGGLQGQATEYLAIEGKEVVWSSRVRVADANAVRIYLENVQLPISSKIWVYNETGEVLGPFDRDGINEKGGLWLPPLPGSNQYVEIRTQLADLNRGASINFTIQRISEIVADLADPYLEQNFAMPQAWTDCSIDVSCEGGAPFNIDSFTTAVARLVYANDAGGTYLCSGGLVNDTVDGSFIPYMLTANHCFDSETEADSLVAYFDYRSSVCDGSPPSLGSVPQVTGSDLLASDPVSDFTFVQLDSDPGARTYLGWTNAAPADSQTIYGIHHPAGEKSHYSTSSFLQTGPIECGGLPRPDFLYSAGLTGSTAGGSSGSPVFNDTGQILGQLYGACHYTPWDDCDYPTYNRVDGAFATTYPHIQPWVNPDVPTCTDDVYEEDDSCFGNFMDVGESQDHLHCDEDWVYFNSELNHRYVIETTSLIGGSDTTLALHDSCGEQFLFDDDGGDGVASRIEFTADNSTSIDIRVQQFADAYADGKGYTITVTDITEYRDLAVGYSGTGFGTVTSEPVGIDCPGVCDATYILDHVVTLTASADPGSVFVNWTGDCSGSNPEYLITMSDHRYCEAVFDLDTPTEYQSVYSASGPVSVVPGGPMSYDLGYDVSDANANLTGIGVRVHFDSSKLTFDGVDGTLAFGRLFDEGTVVAEADSSDFDGSAETDQFVLLAWTDFGGAWPGTLPEILGTMHFTSAGDFTGVTNINYSASDVAAGYGFDPISTEVNEQLCNLDVDGNASYGALTDGVLVVRYLFGFSGSQLTNGAIGGGATRSDPAAIIEYLNGCSAMLDVDGNGSNGALTDGVLIVRHMFGFTGDQLINGAIGGGATRTDAASIMSYIDGYMPALAPLAAQQKSVNQPVRAEQQISTRVKRKGSGADRWVFDVNVDYASLGTTDLTGLGLRLHFDSSVLRLEGISNIYAGGELQHQVQADTHDLDGDPSTDQYINVAWMDPMGGWPGSAEAKLFDARFSMQKRGGSGSTTVRYSIADVAAGTVIDAPAAQLGTSSGKNR